MTAKELASLPAKQVRTDENLIRLYIEEYRGVFGFEPNCASCTFNHDWNKFVQAVLHGSVTPEQRITNLNKHKMATFRLKRQFLGEILWYKKDGKTHRLYGRNFTEDFAKEYLKHGDKEQIKEREAKFEKLPESDSKSTSEEKGTSTPEKKDSPAETTADTLASVSKPVSEPKKAKSSKKATKKKK